MDSRCSPAYASLGVYLLTPRLKYAYLVVSASLRCLREEIPDGQAAQGTSKAARS